jgi:hypothetical protein
VARRFSNRDRPFDMGVLPTESPLKARQRKERKWSP